MIHSIECSATFASSGFTVASLFQPQTGITAVVGPNGSGKTFSTIEMIRYLLYGKAALRGKASDYKNLTAKGDFTIREKRYVVARTPTGESVTDDAGTVLAVGAKAVNEKMTELMGYNLDVFDVCNASVQGDTHLFSRLQPAQRKRMIDQVVGLASNEAVEKMCRAEATVLRREADALAKNLVVPTPMTLTFPGAFSDVLEIRHKEGREARTMYDQTERKVVTLVAPTPPEFPAPSEAEIDVIEREEDARKQTEAMRAHYAKVPVVAKPALSEADYVHAELRNQRRAYLDNLGPKPELSLEEAEQLLREWSLYDMHVVGEDVTCPKCHHFFRTTGESPLEPVQSRAYARAQIKTHNAWDGVDDTMSEGLDLTNRQIADGRAELRAYKASQEAQESLKALPVHKDRSEQLRVLRGRQGEWNGYLTAQLRFERQREANKEAEAALEGLPCPPTYEELDAVALQIADARAFEAEFRSYNEATIRYNELNAQITEIRTLADEFRKGGEALADARATIKAFLAPALSRVASSLLYDMTHGKLDTVSVDDDMNILVGSQTLETLSGGGLTAANIALRIALGQVLVSGTFPVFLGDEIDADVDDVRREAIIESLVGLKNHLDQIILVTHRDIGSVADSVYDLGNTR